MGEEKELNLKKIPDEKNEEPVLAPVVTGKAEVKKKSEAKKFAETLFKGDIAQVKKSLWKDVIIPALQDTLWSMLERAGRGLIFGDSEPRRKSDERGIPARQIDFTRYSRRPERRYEEPLRTDRDDVYDYGCIWFEYEADAEDLRRSMRDILRTYGWVSVGQMLELSGQIKREDVKSVYNDRDFGWEDLRDTDITRARGGGWYLRLPRPKPAR